MQAGHCQVQYSLSKPAARMQHRFRLRQQLEQAEPRKDPSFKTNSSSSKQVLAQHKGLGEMLDTECDMLLETGC